MCSGSCDLLKFWELTDNRPISETIQIRDIITMEDYSRDSVLK